MRITDNQHQIDKQAFQASYPYLTKHLLDIPLKQLAKEKNILVFPHDLQDCPDLDKDAKIVETVGNHLKTSNLIGFFGYKTDRLTIHSRFSQGEQDYFLHYMLQKVLQINLTNLNTSLSWSEQVYQFLPYLFPKYLQVALRKGLYKTYRRYHYNDNKLKGNLNIGRHLKENTPFMGNIAYSTRELTPDNDLTQLIRHTIEHIKATQSNSQQILNSTPDIRQAVTTILGHTPSYQRSHRQQIISSNATPLRHAYFHDYRALQKLCLMILTNQGHTVSGNAEQIHGILFDVAWLWEEYLATLLGQDFLHPQNRASKLGLSLFTDHTRTVYPDFYKRDKSMVLDAKYKRLDDTEKGISRADLYQVMAYLYILQAKRGGLIYPSQSETAIRQIGKLQGYGAKLHKYALHIPQDVPDFATFIQDMAPEEEKLLALIHKIEQDTLLP